MKVAVYLDPCNKSDCIGPARLEWMISNILCAFFADPGKGWQVDLPNSHPWHNGGAMVDSSMSRPFCHCRLEGVEEERPVIVREQQRYGVEPEPKGECCDKS